MIMRFSHLKHQTKMESTMMPAKTMIDKIAIEIEINLITPEVSNTSHGQVDRMDINKDLVTKEEEVLDSLSRMLATRMIQAVRSRGWLINLSRREIRTGIPSDATNVMSLIT